MNTKPGRKADVTAQTQDARNLVGVRVYPRLRYFQESGNFIRVKHAITAAEPGQMAVVAYGRYAGPQYDMGVQDDLVIPHSIVRIPAEFVFRSAFMAAGDSSRTSPWR